MPSLQSTISIFNQIKPGRIADITLGGVAAIKDDIVLGDVTGHDFHGNQYTVSNTGAADAKLLDDEAKLPSAYSYMHARQASKMAEYSSSKANTDLQKLSAARTHEFAADKNQEAAHAANMSSFKTHDSPQDPHSVAVRDAFLRQVDHHLAEAKRLRG